MDIIQRIKTVIANQLGLPVEKISDNAHLQNDLFADSLDILNIKLSLEDEFAITFTEDDLKNILTIKGISDSLSKIGK